MDPSTNVRAAFLREVCRSLDQTSAGGGGAEAAAAAAAGAAAGGGAWTLRFMAYLCLAAFEVRKEAVVLFGGGGEGYGVRGGGGCCASPRSKW